MGYTQRSSFVRTAWMHTRMIRLKDPLKKRAKSRMRSAASGYEARWYWVVAGVEWSSSLPTIPALVSASLAKQWCTSGGLSIDPFRAYYPAFDPTRTNTILAHLSSLDPLHNAITKSTSLVLPPSEDSHGETSCNSGHELRKSRSTARFAFPTITRTSISG